MNQPLKPKTPGEFIREKLLDRGWTQADLAKILGRTTAAVNEIISGKRGVSPETAIQLAAAFENDAQEWLTLDTAFRLSLTAADVETIKYRTKLYSVAPIKDMERRGWISQSDTAVELEQELKRFFEVDSFSTQPQIAASLRSSLPGELNTAQRAWCIQAKRLAATVSVSNAFNSKRLESGIKQLKRLATWPDGSGKVPVVLSEMGIRFVVVEPLPKTRIDGAAFWLDEESPVIALSIRYDRIDSFWQTLGHEISHIRHRDGEAIDIDITGEDRQSPLEQDDVERRAERESAAAWIDPDELASFVVRVGPLYSKTRINQFANKLRIHPGIIVGQLQDRGQIGYHACRDSLVKIRDFVTTVSLTDGWGHPNPLRKA